MQQQYTALLRASAVLRSSQPAFTSRLFASSAASQPQQAQNYDSYSVPAGHQNSDLGSIACNISLNRRRDLTLREDLKVFADGKETTLAALMRVCVLRLEHERRCHTCMAHPQRQTSAEDRNCCWKQLHHA